MSIETAIENEVLRLRIVSLEAKLATATEEKAQLAAGFKEAMRIGLEQKAKLAEMREALEFCQLRQHQGFDESGSHFEGTCEVCQKIKHALAKTL